MERSVIRGGRHKERSRIPLRSMRATLAVTVTPPRKMLTSGVGMLKAASKLGVGSGTVQRIAYEMRR
jgi:hypothetical protein